jgi:hypothetical protein
LVVDLNVALPLASSLLSLLFAALLIDQWRERRRPYQLVWAIGMLWYGVSAGTEWVGGAFGWSEPLYKAWYLIGAIWVAGWLGLGTVYLLGRTRFGFAFALSLFLAGLFTYLTQARYDYPGSGPAPLVYFAVAVALAVGVIVLTMRGDPRWPHLAAVVVVGGSVVSAVLVATVTLRAPGWVVDPVTQIPTGELFPGYIRLLTPFFNITGAFALTLGALYSAYIFMPKRRLIRYRLGAGQGMTEYVRNLVIAPVAIIVNLAASLPLAARALATGTINSRVPATVLIAVGAIIPAITSGMNRFGSTGGFFVGEFLGVLFLFAGFLVSIEIFANLRVPFTSIVLWRRRIQEPSANR